MADDDLSNNGNDGIDDVDEALKERISQAVDAATKGLKRVNSELKGEKSELREQYEMITKELEGLGGLDTLKQLGNADTVRNLVEMQKRFQADEQGKLLSEGKYDEWFDRRTAALRRDHENQIKGLQAQLEEVTGKATNAENTLRKKILETDVSAAAVDAGVEASALLDVQLRVANTFEYDAERGRHVLRDEDGGVVFGKDGATPKTIREWLEDQKEISRHWWPASRGGGAEGSARRSDKKSLGQLDMKAYEAERKAAGFKPF